MFELRGVQIKWRPVKTGADALHFGGVYIKDALAHSRSFCTHGYQALRISDRFVVVSEACRHSVGATWLPK